MSSSLLFQQYPACLVRLTSSTANLTHSLILTIFLSPFFQFHLVPITVMSFVSWGSRYPSIDAAYVFVPLMMIFFLFRSYLFSLIKFLCLFFILSN